MTGESRYNPASMILPLQAQKSGEERPGKVSTTRRFDMLPHLLLAFYRNKGLEYKFPRPGIGSCRSAKSIAARTTRRRRCKIPHLLNN